MEYRLTMKLNSNCLLMEDSSGRSLCFDKAGFILQMRESLRLELQKEIKGIVQHEEQVVHKNLIKYSSLEKYDGEVYLVRNDDMLREFSQLVTVDLKEACRILLMILDIMQLYHQQGITLGGVSMGQLKKNEAGEVFLQDPPVMNHLSKSLEPLYRIDLPREVIKHQNWSEKSDVFSWGELAYRLFCEEDAFFADTPEDRINKIVQNNIIVPVDIQPKLSAELSQLIVDCLSQTPEERPSVDILINKITRMLNEGTYQVSDEEANSYADKARSNIKKFLLMERFQIWFRKYGFITCAITGVIIVIVAISFFAKAKRTITVNTPPRQVVDYYFQGIETLNTLLLDEALYKVKKDKSLEDMITNLFVLNKAQQGMSYSAQDFITASFPELKTDLLEESSSRVKYRTNYTLKIIMVRQIRYIQRTVELTVQPVKKIWQITDIKVIKDKNWEENIPEPTLNP